MARQVCAVERRGAERAPLSGSIRARFAPAHLSRPPVMPAVMSPAGAGAAANGTKQTERGVRKWANDLGEKGPKGGSRTRAPRRRATGSGRRAAGRFATAERASSAAPVCAGLRSGRAATSRTAVWVPNQSDTNLRQCAPRDFGRPLSLSGGDGGCQKVTSRRACSLLPVHHFWPTFSVSLSPLAGVGAFCCACARRARVRVCGRRRRFDSIRHRRLGELRPRASRTSQSAIRELCSSKARRALLELAVPREGPPDLGKFGPGGRLASSRDGRRQPNRMRDQARKSRARVAR